MTYEALKNAGFETKFNAVAKTEVIAKVWMEVLNDFEIEEGTVAERYYAFLDENENVDGIMKKGDAKEIQIEEGKLIEFGGGNKNEFEIPLFFPEDVGEEQFKLYQRDGIVYLIDCF